MSKRLPKKWRIIDPKSGTYYAGPSGIGPRFGATREAAMTFGSLAEAAQTMGHWAFATCRIELPDSSLHPERGQFDPKEGGGFYT